MIDWERVATLRDEVGEDSFAEVVTMFLDEVDEVIARLRLGVPLPDVERALHFLKGGVLNLGFADLGALCQEGERLAAEGHPDRVDQLAVVELYERSRNGFLAALDREAA